MDMDQWIKNQKLEALKNQNRVRVFKRRNDANGRAMSAYFYHRSYEVKYVREKDDTLTKTVTVQVGVTRLHGRKVWIPTPIYNRIKDVVYGVFYPRKPRRLRISRKQQEFKFYV